MFDCSVTANPQKNLKTLASQMHRNSLRIAPVSATHQTNSTQTHQKNSSDTWSNTNTGAHSKWSQPVSKSPQPEILHDRSSDIVASAFKNSVSDMLTLLKTCRLYCEKHESKIQKIGKTQSHWNPRSAMRCYKTNGER